MQATLPRLADLEDAAFNPFELESLATGDAADPYPMIHQLREQSSVHAGGYRELFTDVPDNLHELNQYTVFGYDPILQVLTDPETFGNREAFIHTLGRNFGNTISVMDAPEHPRYRRIFQKAFLPQVVAKWGEAVVDPVVSGLMDNFAPRGAADLVEEFTHHYPFQIIYRQLALEPDQAPIFHKLAIAQIYTSVGMSQGFEASKKLGEFFGELVRLRRERPGDDLISQLATVEADGERLPEDVLVSFLRQLMNAGGDTTYRGTSVLLAGLLANPDQLEAVRADRSLLPQAIEEALRWEGPVLATIRYVRRDTVLDGHPLPEGAILNVVLGSANRDPSKFQEPDKFDIFRDRSVRHLGFASGPHVCIGQHLARVEMTRAVNALLDNLPGLRLDPDKPPPRLLGHKLRVPEHIYVRFDAA